MFKIMFVCHGNICRSPMAEFVFNKMLSDNNLSDKVCAYSSATSSEEIINGVGNKVYPPVLELLYKKGIDASLKRAIKLQKSDYDKYDLFLCMDSNNVNNAMYIFGHDNLNKIKKLTFYQGTDKDIIDPWYSRNFNICYDDIYKCSEALLSYIKKMI